MMPIELMVGIYLLILGLSVMMQSEFWLSYARMLVAHPFQAIPFGFVALIFGLAIVIWHPTWSWTPHVLTTLLGWIMTLKGAALLMFPKLTLKLYPLRAMNPLFLKLEGLCIAIVGGVIIYFAL